MPSRPLSNAPITQEQAHLPGHSPLRGTLAIALAAVLWALAAVVAKSLFEDGVTPLELTQARAFLTFGGLALLRPWRGPKVAGRASWRTIVALGLAITLVNAAYYIAIERLAVAVAIVVQYTAPALVVIWVALRDRVRPSLPITVAVTAAVFGVTLVSEIGSVTIADLDAVGLVAAGASAVLFSAYTILSEKAERIHGPVGALFRAFLVASCLWIAHDLFAGAPWSLVEPDNILRVAYVGLAGTLAPFLLYVWGVKQVQSQRAVVVATLEPPAAALVAWLWLDQTLSTVQLIGSLVIIASVLALQLDRRSRSAILRVIDRA